MDIKLNLLGNFVIIKFTISSDSFKIINNYYYSIHSLIKLTFLTFIPDIVFVITCGHP